MTLQKGTQIDLKLGPGTKCKDFEISGARIADMLKTNEIEGLEGPNPVFRYPPRTAANGV